MDGTPGKVDLGPQTSGHELPVSYPQKTSAAVTHVLALFSETVQSPAESMNRPGGRDTMSASYRDLRVWQNAMDLVVAVYDETQGFPRALWTDQPEKGCRVDSKQHRRGQGTLD